MAAPSTHSRRAPPGDAATVLIAPVGLASCSADVDQPRDANSTVPASTPARVYTTPFAAHPARPSLTTPGCSATSCPVGLWIAARLDILLAPFALVRGPSY